jgi:hypothetical protein
VGNGGHGRVRTYDLFLVEEVLSQLSYASKLVIFIAPATHTVAVYFATALITDTTFTFHGGKRWIRTTDYGLI